MRLSMWRQNVHPFSEQWNILLKQWVRRHIGSQSIKKRPSNFNAKSVKESIPCSAAKIENAEDYVVSCLWVLREKIREREVLSWEKQVMKKQQFSSIPLDGVLMTSRLKAAQPLFLLSSSYGADSVSANCLHFSSALTQHFWKPRQLFKER